MPEPNTRFEYIAGLWQSVTDRGRALVGIKRAPPLGVDALIDLAGKLLSGRGEASGAATAAAMLAGFSALSEAEQRLFLERADAVYGPDLAALEQAAREFLDAPDAARAADLFARAEPLRQELIRRLNHAPGGTFALVKMRETLLAAMKDGAALEAFDRDFRHLFASWFNRGFLVLRRIEWTTPANILEKIIRYEAVHEISNWDELRRRLDPPDRRLYAFFHPALADEPLIFVEVALTSAIPDAIQPLLTSDRAALAPQNATTAVFYSISNAQAGLAGVSFGNFLIKQVVEDLRRELPRLQTFVTLSPVPGLARWLAQERADEASRFLGAEPRRLLAAIEAGETPEGGERALASLAAAYFLQARTPSGRVIDPVARFHLGNGARLERINPRGDLSPAGLRQSLGVMVNYRYDLDEIEANHEAFANRGTVAASSAVRKLAAGSGGKG
ncbi:MAG: malonyl-CoA decarboxylase [Pseudomonadota bacterium]|nr:malonyl-CoA decarboxylase [Pseudomonadota bacterium]